MPFRLGWIEIVLILVIIFMIFGAGKLPQLFEAMGRGIRSFRTASKKPDDEDEPVTKRKRRSSRA
jgi:sec-independent protein translocase protein TatA